VPKTFPTAFTSGLAISASHYSRHRKIRFLGAAGQERRRSSTNPARVMPAISHVGQRERRSG
jgi:hypothetical protein